MNEQKYLKLSDIDAYRISFHLSNFIWDLIMKWDWFEKKTLGSQFVNASDSISANIAEGVGRFHKKDKIKFYRYSQGSVKECYDWNQKAITRKLISQLEYDFIFKELEKLGPKLGQLVKYTDEKLKY